MRTLNYIKQTHHQMKDLGLSTPQMWLLYFITACYIPIIGGMILVVNTRALLTRSK